MFDIEICLHAVTEDVPSDELRAYYKANECPNFDAVLDRSPSVRLGNTEIPLPESDGARGPAGRVEDLLSLRGTSEWPPVELPLLDDRLERELIDAFEMQTGDPPFDVLPISQLRGFLAAHHGSRLATTSRSVQ